MNDKRSLSFFQALALIGIISLVISVFLPMAGLALDKSKTASCTSNLRRINDALMMYVKDNNDTFPNCEGTIMPESYTSNDKYPRGSVATQLMDVLMPYVHDAKVFRCPKDTGYIGNDINGSFNIQGPVYETVGSSYLWNIGSQNDEGVVKVMLNGAALSSIKSKSKTIMCYDYSEDWHHSVVIDPKKGIIFQGRHNALYVDGHVALVSSEEINATTTFINVITEPSNNGLNSGNKF